MVTIPEPKISIVMPVLNGGKTMEIALNSLLEQNYPHLEILVIDGASTDNTIDIIKKYEQHIAYWHSKPDGNPQIAINDGTRRATGDLVVQLMTDDFYEPGTLERVAQAFKQHPDADMITCGGRVIAPGREPHQYQCLQQYDTHRELDLNFNNICFGVSAICIRFIRKSLFEKIGYYRECDADGSIFHSADKEFLLRAIVSGAKNIVIDHVGHNYLAHAGSTTYSSNRAMTVRLYIEHMITAAEYLQKPELSDDQRRVMQHWYNHQSARLAFYRLYKRDFSDAFAIMCRDLPKYHFHWLYSFITAAPDFFWRRSLQFLKHHYHQFSGTNIIYGKAQ